MNPLIFAATFALGAVIVANSAEARTRFVGQLVVDSATGTCSEGDPTGERLVVRFRPAGVGDNGPDSLLGIFFDDGAYGFVLPGASFDATFRTVNTFSIFDGGGQAQSQKIKFKTQKPATIDPTTNFITVTGTIKGFDDVPDCNANFTMGLTRREG